MKKVQHELCMLSFDVEDWFQVENLKPCITRRDWERFELRVVINTRKILRMLAKSGSRATFFVLGWVAERAPELIKEIHTGGHEIASHGYGHDLIYNLSRDAFREDVLRSKKFLESMTKSEIWGYRAPNFSITEWALDVIRDCGFRYDSSLFPAFFHDRYGKVEVDKTRERPGVGRFKNGLSEVIIPTIRCLKLEIPWGGGGYFRVLPYRIYRKGVIKSIRKKGSFLFYLHPWELDPQQPSIKGLPLAFKLRHYVGLRTTEYKLRMLLEDFKFVSIKEWLVNKGTA